MWTDILFDLDGTLTDPGEGITGSVRFALEQMQRPVPEQAILERFVGPPLDESFAEYSGFAEHEIPDAITFFRQYYSETGHRQNKIFEGMKALLAELQAAGRRLYVATTKPTVLAHQVLQRFDIGGHFQLVCGSEMTHAGRPKAEVVRQVLDEAGIDAQSAVMVGDRRYDVAGAHANGLPCVGVLFGYGDLAEMEKAGADYIVYDVPGLRDVLLSN